MSISYQKTLKDDLKFKGIGLHSGVEVNLRIRPMKENSGIILKELI